MSLYEVDKLMSETRRLAADYYRTTQQPLPVSNELAKYDVSRLLPTTKHYQIKSRVIFHEGKSGYRVGQLNPDGDWEMTVLVLYDPDYQPFEIYGVEKQNLIEALQETDSNRQKRGAMSIAKFKAIAELLWSIDSDN